MSVQPPPPRETLDFLFEFGKEATERQAADAEALDGKTVQVFAAASVVLGLLAVSGDLEGRLVAVLLVLAVVAYLVVALETIEELWVRKFRTSNQPDQLWRRYWNDDVADIKHAIVEDTASGYVENQRILRDKRTALLWALGATGAEVALVGGAVIYSLA